MSSCYCNIPAHSMATLRASACFAIKPPVIPIKLTAMAAMIIGFNPEREDIKLGQFVANMTLPRVQMPSAPLMQISAILALAPGVFTLDDLPKLEVELAVAANSLNSHVTPGLRAALMINLAPLMQLALAARLMLTLQAAGLDPLDLNFPAKAGEMAGKMGRIIPPKFALIKPVLPPLAALAALPQLLKVAEAMKIPIGDPMGGRMMATRLNLIAKLTPPKLALSISAMLKIGAIVSAIEAIVAAFGPDAMSAAGQSRISFMMSAVAKLNMAIPLPPIDIGQLDLLPKLENVVLGEQIAGSSAMNMGLTGLKPPKLAIAPMLAATIALKASLGSLLKVPPLTLCSNCGI